MLFQNDFTIPLTGLESVINGTLFAFLGMGLSILTIYIFPRIFAPLFLKIKKKVFNRYENAYIQKQSSAFSPSKLLLRSVYSILLLFGL
ncbi:MAG: hypothetical protein EU541_05285, partial [Promethearchaeota archaeon]